VARGRTLGALTLVRSEVERGYQAADLTLAEELARRVALSVDNARLYREAQSLNSELEARVAERTAALQATNHQLENEIAEHRRTQTELAELRRRQLDGREAERLFLAQELHDGPVQELYGVAYRLEQLAQPDLNDVNQTLLAKTQERVQKVMVSLRAMASDLRPPTLAEFGLERTILSHIDQFQPSYPHIQIEHDLQPDGTSLPENVRLALFRIYQAALNNVIRHANATKVVIQFRFDSDKIYLTVEDNGRGFVLPRHWIDLARQGHLGLVGMVERAEAIGGQTTVRSSPDQGALIQVVVPRHPPA
jgi:signal transduction histidine kinase